MPKRNLLSKFLDLKKTILLVDRKFLIEAGFKAIKISHYTIHLLIKEAHQKQIEQAVGSSVQQASSVRTLSNRKCRSLMLPVIFN